MFIKQWYAYRFWLKLLHSHKYHRLMPLGLFLALMVGVFSAYSLASFADGAICGDLNNEIGPYDYTDPFDVQEYLASVERKYFTPQVETLKHGETIDLASDLDHTLRAFPNHHRALYAMSKYQLTTVRSPTAKYLSAACYFERGIKFKPTDGIVRLIYGIYLHKSGNIDAALVRYQEAEKLAPESADVQYNLGLLFFELKQYKKAKTHAIKAYELGYPLPGLKIKLRDLGVWN